jgi:hypothetical protein
MSSFFEEPPPPFVCVICGREKTVQPWTRREEFRPPICNGCSSRPWSYRTRIPNMTRGDHRQMQRLAAMFDALAGEAGRIAWGGKYGWS